MPAATRTLGAGLRPRTQRVRTLRARTLRARTRRAWPLRALAASLALTLGTPAALPNDAKSLTVIVKNLRSDAGEVHVAIWRGPEGFADGDFTLAEAKAPADAFEKRIVFDGLPPGHYALAAFHDENGNGEFDRTLIGLPAEGLGFSNGAWIEAFGPPSFEKAAIEIKEPQSSTVIELRY